jgi:hypothetical protein
MSATLSIVNNFEMESLGTVKRGKQGSIADAFDEAFDLTVDGACHIVEDELATSSVATLWDEDDDSPADFDYMHFWADQDCYIQIIGTGTNVIFKVEAKVPFVLPGFDDILAAANTTAITGGAEPSLTAIDSIIVGNYSGQTMSYSAKFID